MKERGERTGFIAGLGIVVMLAVPLIAVAYPLLSFFLCEMPGPEGESVAYANSSIRALCNHSLTPFESVIVGNVWFGMPIGVLLFLGGSLADWLKKR